MEEHAIYPVFFQLGLDPMEKLLLVNFEKDPDICYIGFEPQYVNDQINGIGLLVIGWRKDGFVDVFYEEGVHINPEKYHITGKGLHVIVQTVFEQAKFEISDQGIDTHIAFMDIFERRVELRIKEWSSKRRKPFGLLAPMGYAAEKPYSLPLIFLHDFYFVRRASTDIMVSIDGDIRVPDKLPLPLDWSWMYFARYSPKPHIVSCNDSTFFEVNHLALESKRNAIQDGGVNYQFMWNDDEPLLDAIRWKFPHSDLVVQFKKPLVDPTNLNKNEMYQSDFTLQGHVSTGTLKGEIVFERTDDLLNVQISMSGGWRPIYSKCSLLFLYTVASIFRKWVTNYYWKAKFKLIDGKWHTLDAHWENRK